MQSAQVTYNPGILGDEELVRSFVVRNESLELILETLRENAASTSANRHLLIIGPRGIGKTMLVRRAAAEVRSDPAHASQWYPLVFGEESYPVGTPGEFWLEALFHLADQTQEDRWRKAWKELLDDREETRLYERALAQLLDFADRESKRLLLVVENLNMLLGEQLTPESAWVLRHTLTNEPRLMLLGTAINRFEEIANVDRAWFEMFSIHELKPLDVRECGILWRSTTDAALEPGPLRAIRILTGGNPRLLTLLAGFARNRSFRELMEQLIHLIDDHTEYFKGHLDNLAAKERKVFVALLEHWDPVGTAELARMTRLGVNEVSALLGRLVKRGAVEVADQKARRKLYQAAERLYNIYYLMRRRGHPTGRVRAVVSFMMMFYETEELVTRAGELTREACQLAEGMRADHYTAFVELLDRVPWELKHRFIACAPPEFFQAEDAPHAIRELPRLKGVALVREAHDLYSAGRFQEAESRLRQVLEQDSTNVDAWIGLGIVLAGDRPRLPEAEQALSKAVELRPKLHHEWYDLAVLLSKLRRWEEAERAFRKAIELRERCAPSWRSLGEVLQECGRKQEAEQAYRKATDLDPDYADGWNTLGHLLLETGPPEEAERVWTKALELHPKTLSACAVHLLDLKLRRGVDRNILLCEAREWVERGRRQPRVLDVFARFVLGLGLKEGIPEAGNWAREAYSKKPRWEVAETLMLVLAEEGRWNEALDVSVTVLEAAKDNGDAQSVATEFLIRAAAAGHSSEALEKLTASPGIAVLEPLAVGLRIYTGETPIVAKEVLEVGQDVAERIQQRQQSGQPSAR